jgi:hypothetical protein
MDRADLPQSEAKAPALGDPLNTDHVFQGLDEKGQV